MAAVITGNFAPVLFPTRRLIRNSGACFSGPSPLFSKRSFAAKVRASSTTFVETKPKDPIMVEEEEEVSASKNILACPICYEPLMRIGDAGLSIGSTSGSSLQCKTCKKAYSGNETHLELTAATGFREYRESISPTTEFFRTPLISFLYERGWRQNFIFGGYPGPEKEFEMAKNYLTPALGGNIIDASCGSGLFTRLFAKSELFSLVVALDYSENMLRQCYDFIQKEENFPKEKVILVRADISRLPFASNSIDAVHAGAAIHCWPSPSTAVAEISRVLRPGGVFVATTTILDGPFSFVPFLRNFRRNVMEIARSHIFLSEGELEDICRACGLVGFTCQRNGPFVMISARKPS